jgi:integrase
VRGEGLLRTAVVEGPLAFQMRRRAAALAEESELLILTGQRRCKIGALRWEWIDEKAKTITLPRDH